MKHRILHFLYYIIQWSWGILQNIAGLLVFLYLYIKNPKRDMTIFHAAVVCDWDNEIDCMGLGMFVFMAEYNKQTNKEILVHEYGHTIQSLILGPLYLLVIALPSLIWAKNKALQKYRKENNKSYYWLYCEKWANRLGEAVTKLPSPQE